MGVHRHGVLGLVFAARLAAGLEPFSPGMEPNPEADTCYIHFADLETAVETAALAQTMITDPAKRQECAQLAVEEGFED